MGAARSTPIVDMAQQNEKPTEGSISSSLSLRFLPFENLILAFHPLQIEAAIFRQIRPTRGLVQGGVANGLNIDKLISLGSISYEPLLVFYRGDRSVDLLSQLSGKRLAIGPVGSGTRSLALQLLAANGIEPGGATALVDLDPEDAAKALIEGNVDGVFLMGDVASSQLMRKLLQTPGIRLFNFIQADALCPPHRLFGQADPSGRIPRFRKKYSRRTMST